MVGGEPVLREGFPPQVTGEPEGLVVGGWWFTSTAGGFPSAGNW
ncbi:MAG: hypothetical protein ACHBN1_12365 [Heteroscytonema crispum UTEX LB 1556]